MASESRSRVSVFVLIVLSAAVWVAGDYFEGRASEDNEAYFPNVTLVTQEGKRVQFYDELIRDRIVLISFMYTQCQRICGRATENLVQVQKALGERLGREVFMYSITLDPQHDRPEVLKAYAKNHGANWTFLTGSEVDIAALQKKLGLANAAPETRAKLGLEEQDTDDSSLGGQHSGMVVIGYAAFNRWTKVSVLSTPDQMLQVIERMKPPVYP